jgi:hypothetical protein
MSMNWDITSRVLSSPVTVELVSCSVSISLLT